MSWRRQIAKFRGLFGRGSRGRELREEFCAHLAMEEEENLESGMSPEEARYTALRRFGNVTSAHERSGEMWGWNSLETLLQDVRYGLRQLRRSPGFTAVAVLTLALGIGANTAIFSLIDAVMLRMLPVQTPEELLQVQYGDPNWNGEGGSFTNPLWEQVRDQQDVFSGVFTWGREKFDLAQGGAVHLVNGIWVSGNFFNTLRLFPAAGRLIVNSEDRRGCPAVAVLSYGFWQDRYGGANNAIGSILPLNSHSFEVIGVAPPGFYGMNVGEKFDVATPICATTLFDGKESRLDHRSWWWLSVAGRIRAGVSPDQATARLRVLSPAIFTAALPEDWSLDMQRNFVKKTLVVAPVATGLSDLHRQFKQPLRILMAVVGSCSSLPAPTSQASCWRVPPPVTKRSRCGRPWGRAAGA